jgi:hypothetical protein
MKARRCGGCGAALPDPDEFERSTCQFCGMTHDAATPGGASIQIAIETPETRRFARGAIVVISLVFLISVLAPLAFIYMQWRASSALAPLRAFVSTSTSSVKKTRTTSNLRDLPRGFHELETTAPPGGYASVDAVSALPWALAIAQAWSGDARIARIDVERMRPDGAVNAQDDAEASVTYRFASPGRGEELQRRAETSGQAELDSEFWVRLNGGRAQVIAHYNSAGVARVMDRGPGRTPGHPVALPLTEFVSRPGAKRTLKPLPFYRGYMIYSPGEGWVWYFSTLANETFTRMRARDAAPYPYR